MTSTACPGEQRLGRPIRPAGRPRQRLLEDARELNRKLEGDALGDGGGAVDNKGQVKYNSPEPSPAP